MIDERKLLQSTILESKIIKRKGEGNVHYLHIPQHLTRKITRINPDVVIAWEYNPSALKAVLWCKRHGRHGRHAAFGAEHRARAEAHAAYHHPSRRLSRRSMPTARMTPCIRVKTG